MNVQLRKGGFSYDLYRISNIDQRNSNDELVKNSLQSQQSGIRDAGIEYRTIKHPTSNITELISTSSAPTQTARSLQQELLPIIRIIILPGRRLKE